MKLWRAPGGGDESRSSSVGISTKPKSSATSSPTSVSSVTDTRLLNGARVLSAEGSNGGGPASGGLRGVMGSEEMNDACVTYFEGGGGAAAVEVADAALDTRWRL